MPFPQHPLTAWGVTEMGYSGGVALDSRPLYKVGDFHLGHSLRNLLTVVLGRARDNPYRFEACAADTCDIALIDMTERGGPEVADVLSVAAGASPVVRVGRRTDAVRGQDDLLYADFTDKLLATLNRVVDEHLSRHANGRQQRTSAPAALVAGDTGLGSPAVMDWDVQNGSSGDESGVPRILVVDDSPTVRRQLAVALHRMGLDSDGAASGAQALETLLVRRYDLVFVDVVMPDMDGYRLTRSIKRAPLLRPLPVVILTSRTSPFDLARGALAGCDSYLVKPLSMQALRETMNRLVTLPTSRAAR